MAVGCGDVRAALLVRVKEQVDIYIADGVAVAEQNIFVGRARYERGAADERVYSVCKQSAGVLRGVKRRQNEHTLALTRQIPRLACAEVIHERAVVALGYNADLGDAGVHHIGKREIYEPVSSAERDGAHGSHICKLGKRLVIGAGIYYAENIVGSHLRPSSFSPSYMALGSIFVPFLTVTPLPITATPHLSRSSMASGRSPTTAFSSITAFSATMAY